MQNLLTFTPEARGLFDRLQPALERVLSELPGRDAQLFRLRLERHFQNLFDGLKPVYGARDDFDAVLERLVTLLAEGYRARPEALKILDLERDLTPDWFQREGMVGYVFYVERFAGTLQGVAEKLDYIEALGATYLHLMKIIKPREGENDGGYAVADYEAVDPKVGTIEDLDNLCRVLRERGVSVCVDLVLNHCAKEHPWAQRARAGNAHYQDYFYMYPDRTMPDEYEKTLPEIFPDFAPGSFSYYPESDKWVWTTFNEYQWDLNWSNPEVFLEIVGVMLTLANRGVEVFRLDAVAFMWKRLGTNSQNQPEVYALLQALRACSRVATPAVAHKAEAIVSPQDLIHYFGTGKHHGKVSNIAYHNTLMVQFWSSLASRDTKLMTHTLQEFPRTPTNVAWATYIRGHDDIGWAVTDEDAAAVGLNGFLHRQFLSSYYAGEFGGAHARGAVFQYNPVDARPAHLRDFCELWQGLERGAGAKRRHWASPFLLNASSWVTRSSRATAASPSSTWATKSGCSTTTVMQGTPRPQATTAGCTGLLWTGRKLTGALNRVRSRRASLKGSKKSSGQESAPRTSTRLTSRSRLPRPTRTSTLTGACTRWARWSRCTTLAKRRSHCLRTCFSRMV